MNNAVNQHRWLKAARLLAWRINAGWWLRNFLPCGTLVTAVFTCIIFITKRYGLTSIGVAEAWSVYVLVMTVSALLALVISRVNFYTVEDALIRLEDDLHLHNRLSCAFRGVGEWPAYRLGSSPRLRWRLSVLMGPLAASVLLITSAIRMPHKDAAVSSTYDIEEPTSWRHVQSWIDTLKESTVVEEETLNDLQKKLAELRKTPDDSWYDHSSLEAGDSLREQTAAAIKELGNEVELALNMLRQMQSRDQMLSHQPENELSSKAANEIGDLSDDWHAVLRDLAQGDLRIRSELMSRLHQIDPEQLSELDEEALDAMIEQLNAATNDCRRCSGGALADGTLSAGSTDAGNSGVNEGPGSAPIQLTNTKSDLGTDKIETIRNIDMSHAAIGRQVGVESGEHTVDPTAYNGPAAAGVIDSDGAGGEAVWRSTFVPEERNILKRYFK